MWASWFKPANYIRTAPYSNQCSFSQSYYLNTPHFEQILLAIPIFGLYTHRISCLTDTKDFVALPLRQTEHAAPEITQEVSQRL